MNLERLVFELSDEWRDIELTLDIPAIGKDQISGDSHLRFQLTPPKSDGIFDFSSTAPAIFTRTIESNASYYACNCAKKPRVKTQVREILDDPRNIKQLREFVISNLGHEKIYSLRSYFFTL